MPFEDDDTLKDLVRAARASQRTDATLRTSNITRLTKTFQRGVTNLFEFAVRSPLNPAASLSKRSRLKAFFAASLITIVLMLALTESGLSDGIEAELYDWKVQTLADPKSASDEIVILTLDEATLRDVQNNEGWAYPWPRFLYNKVLRYCEEAGAKAVIFDHIFADGGRNTNDPSSQGEISARYIAATDPAYFAGLNQLLGGRLVDSNGEVREVSLRQLYQAWDDLFAAEVLRHDNVVMAGVLSRDALPDDGAPQGDAMSFSADDAEAITSLFEAMPGKAWQDRVLPFPQLRSGQLQAFPFGLKFDADDPESRARQEERTQADLLAFTWAARNDPAYRGALPESFQLKGTASIGMVNVFPDDRDGVFRDYQLAVQHDGRAWPSMALVTWARLKNLSLDKVKIQADGSWQIGDLDIPVQSDGSLPIKWRGRRDAKDVFGSDSLSEAEFAKLFPRGDVPYTYQRIPLSLVMQDWDRIWRAKFTPQQLAEVSTRTRMEQAAEWEREHAGEPVVFQAPQPRAIEVPIKELLLGDPKKLLGGKIVFIAGTAEGLRDVRPTPLSETTNGVELHATALDMLLNADFLSKAPGWVSIAMLLIGAAIAALAVMFIGSYLASIGITVAITAATIVASMLAYDQMSVDLPMAGPALAPLTAFVASAMLKMFTLDAHTRHIRRFSERYMSSKLVDYVLENPHTMKLGGEKRQLTIFFSDIEGFTGISERLEPEQLTRLINEYLRAMSRVIMDEFDGIVDKFIGDAIMAYWGAPIASEDHAERSCRAALACQRELFSLQPRLKDIAPQLTKLDAQGMPEVEVLRARIGLNTGLVTAGNMGSEKRMNYTVMGDAVNQASRYEGANKTYGTSIMIGESTHEMVYQSFVTRPLDKLIVKGRSKPATVYELIAEGTLGELPDHMQILVEQYTLGYQSFMAREFAKALEHFKQSAEHEERSDHNPSLVYIERCEHFIEHPPEQSWDGVFIMKTK